MRHARVFGLCTCILLQCAHSLDSFWICLPGALELQASAKQGAPNQHHRECRIGPIVRVYETGKREKQVKKSNSPANSSTTSDPVSSIAPTESSSSSRRFASSAWMDNGITTELFGGSYEYCSCSYKPTTRSLLDHGRGKLRVIMAESIALSVQSDPANGIYHARCVNLLKLMSRGGRWCLLLNKRW